MHCTWVDPGEGAGEGALSPKEKSFYEGTTRWSVEKQRARELTLETWSGGDQCPVPGLGRLQRGSIPVDGIRATSRPLVRGGSMARAPGYGPPQGGG